LLLLQGQEAQPRLRVRDATLHELQVGEVLLRVGVEEALGVIAGVQQDLVHLLVEETSLVGNLHGQAVALLGVDDASRGDLSLQQADPVVLQDQPLLHGLEEGDELPGIGVSVASDSSLSREQLVLELRAHNAHPHSFLHCQLEALDRVDHIARGCLRLQELEGSARPDDALLHGLVNGEPLLRGVHKDTGNAAGALQELLQVLRDLLNGGEALLEALGRGFVHHLREHQLLHGDLLPQPPE
ncbi:hypothetical protein N310_05438, partial [Acanthisitta chloris]